MLLCVAVCRCSFKFVVVCRLSVSLSVVCCLFVVRCCCVLLFGFVVFVVSSFFAVGCLLFMFIVV